MITLFLSPAEHSVNALPVTQEGPIYVVQDGDTLGTIALRFGITVEALQSANDIPDPNAVNIGQRLFIPGLEGISGELISEVVPFGSSLTGISRQYQLDFNDLVYLNRISSPSEVFAGVVYTIPRNENQEILVPLIHLSPRSTLIEEAIRTGTSPYHLIADNQIDAAWDILPGETLYGPGKEGSTPNILPEVNSIYFNNLPIIQGETLQIAISTTAPVTITGSFDNETLHFFTEDEQTYYSFHGIHALAEPGLYPIKIKTAYEDGNIFTLEQLVLLSAGGYGNEWVNVPEEYLDDDAIIAEDAFVNPILAQVTSERFWDGRFQYPVDEPCVNSFFGQRRDYNNGGLFFYHTGMDFGICAQNFNIYAPAAGKVVMAQELTIKGNAILIDHGWGVFSGYWHMSEFNVKEGDFVQTGDIIGQIGNTGRSAGPHLHFEIDVTGTPVNPETWLTEEFPQPAP